jgi:hypothetical protein
MVSPEAQEVLEDFKKVETDTIFDQLRTLEARIKKLENLAGLMHGTPTN